MHRIIIDSWYQFIRSDGCSESSPLQFHQSESNQQMRSERRKKKRKQKETKTNKIESHVHQRKCEEHIPTESLDRLNLCFCTDSKMFHRLEASGPDVYRAGLPALKMYTGFTGSKQQVNS